ncbi:2OG-Fe dioxygenase family protein [Pseudoduganella sp. LjRoot289]|uniref:2OG-Fe dioxygenase family protein n=1 Tax=Pseudoduganella sp. LjRoot289 TaxID=3342314 RepID=UPI003ED0F2CD
MTTYAPIYTAPERVTAALRSEGYALLSPQHVAALAGTTLAALNALVPSWEHLELDNYLKDGGRYRRRRHSCFIQHDGALVQAAHRPHWQPLEYNALHGGMHRLFEPMAADTVAQPAWRALLAAVGDACSAVRGGAVAWHIEAHQFRIDTTDGIGRPTPEGAHRDGVDFVAVLLIARDGIKGGETRIFEADGPNGKRFTMTEPWTMLLLDDATVIHESTPIQPLAGHGHRDTLVLTYRAGRFQGEQP